MTIQRRTFSGDKSFGGRGGERKIKTKDGKRKNEIFLLRAKSKGNRELELKCDGAFKMEWPFGHNGIISVYRIGRSPELLIRQVQERYFRFKIIAFRLVEKSQILFVLGRNPHITIVTVEDHAGDGLPEDHAKCAVIGRNLIFSQAVHRMGRNTQFAINTGTKSPAVVGDHATVRHLLLGKVDRVNLGNKSR